MGPVSVRKIRSDASSSGKTFYVFEYIVSRVSVPSDTLPADLIMRAYLYNGSGSERVGPVLGKIGDPAEPFAPPVELLKAGRLYVLALQISESLHSGPHKLKRVVTVFGTKDNLVARVYPKDDLKNYDFPEKDVVKLAE